MELTACASHLPETSRPRKGLLPYWPGCFPRLVSALELLFVTVAAPALFAVHYTHSENLKRAFEWKRWRQFFLSGADTTCELAHRAN